MLVKMNAKINISFFIVFVVSVCDNSQDHSVSSDTEFFDFQRFKLEILETSSFSATYRFENVKIERTDHYFYYCVQVGVFLTYTYCTSISLPYPEGCEWDNTTLKKIITEHLWSEL